MKRADFAAALVAAAAGLAGCVVGPAYRAPAAPSGAEAPFVSLDRAAETASPAADAWWRLYADAKLDGYVLEAFAANQDLAVAEANLAAARAALEAARAGRYPSTAVVAGAIRGRDPETNEILNLTGREPHTIWRFDTLLDMSYELDLFGRVRRSIEAARADAGATAAARDDLKVTIAAETARAYVQICTLGEQLTVARENLEVVSHEAEITTNRRMAGAGSEFEEVRAQALVAQVRSAIPPLEGQRRAALFALAALLGRTPAQAPGESLACSAAPALTSAIPVGDGAALLRRRPDVREAERRLAGATARVGIATAELYPRITLTGFWGGAAAQIPELATGRGQAWGFGPAMQWEFPVQSRPRARLRQAKAAERGALAGFDATVIHALEETEQALSTYSAELAHNADLMEAQSKARRTYDLAHGQFLAGATTQLDLLSAEQSFVSAKAAVAASDSALVQDQIAVFKALGGGWGQASH